MKNKSFYFLGLLCCVFACQPSVHPQEAALLRVLDALEIPYQSQDTLQCMVIPNGGCQGCISSAEAFVMEQIDKDSSLFVIFTAVQSQKILKARLGKLRSHPQIRIDRENQITAQGLHTIYPITYRLAGGKLFQTQASDFKNIP
ncbi:MAG: hypothetical protein HC913_24000 [Microscillaceae bacterium]|nr:hypothetical protein [Microscillaceae bacterium]